MAWMQWYNSLDKPSWTPPPGTIALIWSILYPFIIITFGFVFIRYFQGRVSGRIAFPFAVNLLANLLFMPIFSGLRNVSLACLDILLVWSTLLWCMVAVFPVYRWVAALQVPYFIWVSIATLIQVLITFWNA